MSRRHCSNYRRLFKALINCWINNRDVDQPASATQHIRFSDCLQIPDHIATLKIYSRSTRLVQDPLDSLPPRTIGQLSLHFRYSMDFLNSPIIYCQMKIDISNIPSGLCHLCRVNVTSRPSKSLWNRHDYLSCNHILAISQFLEYAIIKPS